MEIDVGGVGAGFDKAPPPLATGDVPVVLDVATDAAEGIAQRTTAIGLEGVGGDSFQEAAGAGEDLSDCCMRKSHF